MKTQIKTLAFAALAAMSIGATSTSVLADSPRANIREETVEIRLDRLDDRIDWGVKHRELTRQEASRLRTELRDINSLSRRFERSGRGLDRQEMAVLDSRIDRLSQKVAFNNNDHQQRRY